MDVGHGSHPVTEPKGIIISTACHIGPVHGTQDIFEFDTSIHILSQHKIRNAFAMGLISLQMPMFHGNKKMILRERRRNINPNQRAPMSLLGWWCVG